VFPFSEASPETRARATRSKNVSGRIAAAADREIASHAPFADAKRLHEEARRRFAAGNGMCIPPPRELSFSPCRAESSYP
jgi:hypothetical protein